MCLSNSSDTCGGVGVWWFNSLDKDISSCTKLEYYIVLPDTRFDIESLDNEAPPWTHSSMYLQHHAYTSHRPYKFVQRSIDR